MNILYSCHEAVLKDILCGMYIRYISAANPQEFWGVCTVDFCQSWVFVINGISFLPQKLN